MDCEVLQSVLGDFAHLLIPSSQVVINEKEELGAGGYGEVFLALLTGSSAVPTSVAVKRLRIGQALPARRRIATRLARELTVWAKAKHPNILELYGINFSERGEYAYFISAHMAHGNVKDYINAKRPDPEIRLRFVRGITSGIRYLHNCEMSICHGDLKPSNVLVNDDIDAVLCDFGLATFMMGSGLSSGLTTSKSVKGSTRYMSPELFGESEAKHTPESDIWAWACTVFEIMTDCEPYPNAKSDGKVISLLIQGEPPGSVDLLENVVPDTKAACYPSLRSLKAAIAGCWSVDARERPSSSEIFNRIGFPNEPETSESAPVPDGSFSSEPISELTEAGQSVPPLGLAMPTSDPLRPNFGALSQGDDSNKENRRFPDILYEMLEDPAMGSYIRWFHSGHIHGFLIPSIEVFIGNALPDYFPSFQWDTFQKQLSNYEFRKCHGNEEKGRWIHQGNKFRQGCPELLPEVVSRF